MSLWVLFCVCYTVTGFVIAGLVRLLDEVPMSLYVWAVMIATWPFWAICLAVEISGRLTGWLVDVLKKEI